MNKNLKTYWFDIIFTDEEACGFIDYVDAISLKEAREEIKRRYIGKYKAKYTSMNDIDDIEL